jgi:hypothetical protein
MWLVEFGGEYKLECAVFEALHECMLHNGQAATECSSSCMSFFFPSTAAGTGENIFAVTPLVKQ